jgi:23S rRNA (uracil1939-C5)-methyltransferase
MAHSELAIERLAKSGEGVARFEGRTVFVEGALPGERVRAEISGDRGRVLEVLERSSSRREPPCPHAADCGGCSWLHLEEGAQRAAKEEIVRSTLEHLGRLTVPMKPTVFGQMQLGYRRRATLHPVGGGLGFNGRRSHRRVRVDDCPALVPELRTLRPLVGADEVQLVSDGGIGVALSGKVKPEKADALLREGVDCVVLNGRVYGKAHPRADLFLQANAEVNARMVAAVAEAVSGSVLELYAGAGNLTAALKAKAVVAVESAGGEKPRLPNVRWIQGDAEKVVKGLIAEGAKFDTLLLDPPRAGAKGVGHWAKALSVSRVVYVACDPASLARDAADLVAQGFVAQSVQLFDMFPQTHHVEALMVLGR